MVLMVIVLIKAPCNLQIHLLTFQGTRYCAKDPTLIDPDEIRAVRGELEPPTTSVPEGENDLDQ